MTDSRAAFSRVIWVWWGRVSFGSRGCCRRGRFGHDSVVVGSCDSVVDSWLGWRFVVRMLLRGSDGVGSWLGR